MLKCKFCDNETSDTSGICWEHPKEMGGAIILAEGDMETTRQEEFWIEFEKLFACKCSYHCNDINPDLDFDTAWEFFEKALAQQRQEIINDLESNPNEDGSISPNIQHWIEQKQIQLRKKRIIKTKRIN